MRKWVVLVGVVGCAEEFTPSEYLDAQLPKAVVVPTDDDLEIKGSRRDWAGTLVVDGEDGLWELLISSTSGSAELFTPSEADLSVMNGAKDVTLTLAPDSISDELSLAVSDAAGDLLYLLEPARPALLTEERFGPNMLAPATDLGTAPAEGWDLSISSYYMRTDVGDVELYPGAPQEVMLAGYSYRATLLAGYTAERVIQQTQIDCIGAIDRVAFELIRVDPGTVEAATLLRGEDVPPPVALCL